MSLNKKQVEFINSVFGAFEIDVPEISKGVSSTLLKAFAVFSKGDKSKGDKKPKTKDPNAPKKPVNTYFAWLALNRSKLKGQNGGIEEGLSDLLKSEYEKFKKSAAFEKMQKDCEDKMHAYKDEMKDYESSEQSSEDEDDSKKTKGKKTTKAKKVEKSPEEKQPPNVYMAFRKMKLDTIKAGLSEGANLTEALKESYEEFKKTAEYKTLQDKCKADFATWKETKGDVKGSDESDSKEAPSKVETKKSVAKPVDAKKAAPKKADAKKAVAKPVDSDDDDDTFTMPKTTVAEKTKTKKDDKKKKTTKKAEVTSDSEDEE
jgi:hypothetical protein